MPSRPHADHGGDGVTGPAARLVPTGAVRPTVWWWLRLLALSSVAQLVALDVPATLVALPAMRADLGFGLVSAQSLVSAFALGFGGMWWMTVRVVRWAGRARGYL